MAYIKYCQQLLKLLLAINLVLVTSIPTKAVPANSSTNKQPNNTTRPVKKKPRNTPLLNRNRQTRKKRRDFVYFRQPQRQGTPQGTRPAGSRNGCIVAEEIPLTALVPVTKKADGRELRWGLTTKEYPKFWFYVPYELKTINKAKFSLRDRQNHTIYETQLQLTDAPGVIGVSLPPSTPSLEVGKWYQYYLFIDVNCTDYRFSRKQVARGWVKREAMASGFQNQLDRVSPRQRGLFYAKNGIWYDAMASFAELKHASEINSEWMQMLEFVGLGKIDRLLVMP